MLFRDDIILMYLRRIKALANLPHFVRRLAMHLFEVRYPHDFVSLVFNDICRSDDRHEVLRLAHFALEAFPYLSLIVPSAWEA